jgi:hypothetical protein
MLYQFHVAHLHLLAANACESLASATVMLDELAVNKALDNVATTA